MGGRRAQSVCGSVASLVGALRWTPLPPERGVRGALDLCGLGRGLWRFRLARGEHSRGTTLETNSWTLVEAAGGQTKNNFLKRYALPGN